jgi:lipopolysaccharide biosynthesis protein
MERKRILIHAHVFYLNLWDELFSCINNFVSVCGNEYALEIFLTYPASDREIGVRLQNDIPSASVLPVCNRGYDIGPFMEVLHQVDLDRFDYIVKLHTKRDIDNAWVNFRKYNGNAWRKELLSFCITEEKTRQTLTAFSGQPDLGMVASSRMIDPSGIASCHHSSFSNDAIRELGIESNPKTIVWGTMFMARAALFKPLLKWTIEDFEVSPGRNAKEHAINRLASIAEGAFAKVVEGQGYRISDGQNFVWVDRMKFCFKRFFYTVVRYASDFVHDFGKRD